MAMSLNRNFVSRAFERAEYCFGAIVTVDVNCEGSDLIPVNETADDILRHKFDGQCNLMVK